MIRKKRIVAVALGGAVTAAVAIGTSGGAGASGIRPAGVTAAPQTIDAKTHSAEAGKAMSDFCEVISNCQFVGTAPIKVAYDDYRVLGDALYNCGGSDAEDEVAISDERSEATSVDESLSVKVKLGFLGLAKASVEAEVNSKQLDQVATSLKQANTVSVAPGTIGFTETRVPTAYLNGEAHIADGVNLIYVTNLELTYPGYGNQAIDKLDWRNVHKDMTDEDRHSHCAGLPPLYPATAPRESPPPRSPHVVICRRRRKCTRRRLIIGMPLSIPAGTKLTLARGSVIYATGTAGKRRIIMHARRPVPVGAFTLLVRSRRDTTLLQAAIR